MGPFQGLLPYRLSGSKFMKAMGIEEIDHGIIWDVLE